MCGMMFISIGRRTPTFFSFFKKKKKKSLLYLYIYIYLYVCSNRTSNTRVYKCGEKRKRKKRND
jgi:hypothetical protein